MSATQAKPESALGECWAVVELFGHQKIAGKVKEATVAGTGMLRVDVPQHEGEPGYTRFFGMGAIYGINPCDEALARRMIRACNSEPVQSYNLLPLPVDCGSEEHEEPDID